jgi:predicted metal-dependent peptidase
MTNVDKLAMERVLKARAALILARRFYGVLVSNVEPVASRAIPTMATNSKQHFFNPDFIGTLTQEQLEAVQAHETEHDARHHSTRRGERDPKKWNEACDYAINPDLKAEGFKLPEWVLFEERFRGMSAEDIYRTRELDEQKDKPQPQPQPEPEQPDEDEQGEDGDDDAQQPDEQDDDEQSDEPSDESDGESDDGESEGDKPGDAGEGEGDEDGDEGEGTGKGEGEAGDEPGNAGGGAGEGNGEGEPQTSGDPGRCGEVLDAADDASEIADLDSKWERVVRQAASMAKAIGQLPGHVTADIERANNPPQDWREQLRAWIDNGTRRIESWNRPNRRFASQGLILPSSQKDGVNKIACVIDTSGSMDDRALACIRNELQAALDEHAADEIVVIYNDTRVTRVDHFAQCDELVFDPRGRGGTDLKPAFKYVAEEVGDVSGMLVFTDLEIGDPGPEPECPVLFAVYGYPQYVRQYLANTPWNAPGIDVGEH